MAYKFTCPECGETSEMAAKPERATVLCPACAKDVAVPGNKSKSGALIAFGLTLVAVILAVLFIFVYISAKAREAEKQKQIAKRKAALVLQLKEEARLKKIEDARKKWKETSKVANRNNLKRESDFVKALSTLKNYNGGDPDEKAKLIKQIEEYKAADIAKLMAKLDAKAKAFWDNKKFMQAVGVYQDYDGDFKLETDKLRTQGANKYFDLEEQVKKAAQLAQEKAEEEKKQTMKDLAIGLIAGKISESITKFNESPYKKDLPEIAKMVDNLPKVNEIVLNSFKDQVDKKVPVDLKEGKKVLLIKKVEKGRIYTEFKKEKLAIIKKYSTRDLDDSEVLKRLGDYDKATAGLVGGIKAARKKQYDEAEELFQATGDFSIPLMSALEAYKVEQPAEEKVERKVKKVKPLPVDDRKIKVAVKVTKGGKKNLGMGEVEEHLTARLNVNNTNQQGIQGYTVTVIIIGESLQNKQNFQPIHQFKEVLKLDARDKLEKKIPVKNNYNAGAEIGGRAGRAPGGAADGNRLRSIGKSGYKYYSWLWVLRDPSGAIKAKKSKHSKFEKIAAKILQAGDTEFDEKGKGAGPMAPQ